MDPDRDQLQLLSIFHYIAGILAGLGGLLPIFHIVMGIGLVTGMFAGDPAAPTPSSFPEMFAGWLIVIIAVLMMAAFFAFAWAAIRTGKNLAGHRNHGFCVAVACIECIFFPLGTVLGVFTLIVLMRPSVKELFVLSPAAPVAGPA